MVSIANKILTCHIDQNNYILRQEHEGLAITYPQHSSAREKIDSAALLLKTSNQARRESGFQSEEVRKLAACAYQAIKNLSKFPEIPKAKFNKLQRSAFWNLMGQNPPEASSALFDKLIITNHIHYNINRLGITHNSQPLSILVDGNRVNLSDLEEVKTATCIEFYHNGQLAFRTDLNYKLTGYFFCGDRGIISGNYKTSSDSILDKGVVTKNGDGKYYAILGTTLKSRNVPQLNGNHSYGGVVDATGRHTYFGKFGVAWNMAVWAPDPYPMMPFTSHHAKETKIEISVEQYDAIKESVKKDLADCGHGSLLEKNCTEYVVSTFKKANIQATCHITPSQWIWKWIAGTCLPKQAAKKIFHFIDSMPAWASILLHYLNPIYPLNVISGLIQSIISFDPSRGFKNVYNIQYLLRAIFCPWTLYVNDPFTLRSWQKQQKEISL